MLTIVLIIATVAVSILGFKNQEVFNQYKFNAYMIYHRREWQRMLSHGFLHADYMHLGVNMYVLWSFGTALEQSFSILQDYEVLRWSQVYYLVLYLGGIVVASLVSLYKHKNNHYYNSVGASGAVSAVVFANIFLAPMHPLYLFLIPVPIPGFVFGLAYMGYSYYMSQRNTDNVNHDAHFVGALYGFIFPLFIDPTLFNTFN